MKPISFAVGINDLSKEISGLGNLNLEKLFKTGLHVYCDSNAIPNATTCKMIDSHVECYEECGKSKYICDCEVERFVLEDPTVPFPSTRATSMLKESYVGHGLGGLIWAVLD